ncbi:serine/threonine-protein kinase [Bacillus anthracis]|uniref:serine/threonine-protein kinase n=1 Tax=Bacillus anthracis TaxID=1392 RepID=UPI002DB5FB05|nr:serine/threonine-protein kinase [Bacillus anthracis]MEB9458418.1 serine/threonine-protein kinase [Bacillus anthracis]
MPTNEIPIPKYLVDEENHTHHIVKKIGQGGQGAVYQTTDENVVIKVVLKDDEIVQDEKMYFHYKDQIDEVRILNLPKSINIAKPVLMLKKPYNGYVMRLLSNMVPIRKLMMTGAIDDMVQFYIETGSIQRRLQILTKVAHMFSQLHAIPVVYGDLSEENIFISEDCKETETWLIDADNMRHTVDFTKTVYTPGYGAPELVKGISGNTTFSDVYSFAIIAFKVLALIGPFDGDLLFEQSDWADENDWDAEEPMDNFVKAEHGEFPWVEDTDDDRNHTVAGVDRKLILSSGLRKLFQRTFGEEGRNNPTARPTMREWYEALHQASLATMTCPKCTGTYYINLQQCPYPNCQTKRPSVYIGFLSDVFDINAMMKDNNEENFIELDYSDRENDKIRMHQYGFLSLENRSGTHYIQRCHTHDTLLGDDLDDTIEITIDQYTYIKNISDTKIQIYLSTDVKEMGKNEWVEVSSLHGVKIMLPLTKHKKRYINFKLRD